MRRLHDTLMPQASDHWRHHRIWSFEYLSVSVSLQSSVHHLLCVSLVKNWVRKLIDILRRRQQTRIKILKGQKAGNGVSIGKWSCLVWSFFEIYVSFCEGMIPGKQGFQNKEILRLPYQISAGFSYKLWTKASPRSCHIPKSWDMWAPLRPCPAKEQGSSECRGLAKYVPFLQSGKTTASRKTIQYTALLIVKEIYISLIVLRSSCLFSCGILAGCSWSSNVMS